MSTYPTTPASPHSSPDQPEPRAYPTSGGSRDAKLQGAEPQGAESGKGKPGKAESGKGKPGKAEPQGAKPGKAEPQDPYAGVGPMRRAVHHRIDQVRDLHKRLKTRRFGWLVRPMTLCVGWLVFIVGVITIPLPGQGWLTTFLGIGILSLEVAWARRLLDWGLHNYDRFFDWLSRRPKAVRVAFYTALVFIIWLVFAAMTFAGWKSGHLDFLDPTMLALGLER